MNWTTELPTKPGYYWLKNFRRYARQPQALSPRGEIVEIFEVIPNRPLTVFFIGHGETMILDDISSAEWYGPIDPPE